MSAADPEVRSLAAIDRERCVELLGSEQVGRLAWTDDDDHVHIVPVNYRVDNGDICFTSAAGAKLEAARARRAVAFEVDEVEPALRTGWSVVVHGTLTEVTDPEDRQRFAEHTVAWAVSGTHGLRIHPERYEGRRLPLGPGGTETVHQGH